MTNFLLINGPNLNLLGTREPDIYGSTTLEEIELDLTNIVKKQGHNIFTYQTNAEHELINKIHEAKSLNIKCIILNPGAFTHSSVAIRDALAGIDIPFVEIHISNIHSREDFRKESFLSDIAEGVISGLGVEGYKLAINFAINKFG